MALFENYPPVMSTQMVAEITGLQPQQIRILVRNGELPAFQPGRRDYRFIKDDIIRWFSTKTIGYDRAEDPAEIDS